MNRIVGNVIIIDSAMGNNLALTSANQVIMLNKLMINAWAFWSANTTAALLLTGVDTAQDIIFKHDYPVGAPNEVLNPKWFSFGQPQSIDNLKAPVVTAGTAFLYLS